ncbi:MAG: hypothetical protein AAFY19_02870 [Pseudomonadota bacterium]
MLSTLTRTTMILAAGLAFAATPLSAQAVHEVGEQVLAKWSDGLWYPGTIRTRRGDQYVVDFLDGDVATLPTELILHETVEPGDEVLVRGRGPRGIRTVLAERYADALIVSYPGGEREAVNLSQTAFDTISTRPSQNPKYYKPHVLANLCNSTEETVYYALALDTQNGGMRGKVSQGWGKLEPASCEIYDITALWLRETRYPGAEPATTRFASPTFIYGQTLDAFQNQALGGVFTMDKGKRWGGEQGQNEHCVMDRPTISFRHVIDAQSGLMPDAYCRDDWSFAVPFRKLDLPKSPTERGGVVTWTFGE